MIHNFKFGPVVQERSLKDILIFNSGSHFALCRGGGGGGGVVGGGGSIFSSGSNFIQQSRTICAILVEGIVGGNTCISIFLDQWLSFDMR